MTHAATCLNGHALTSQTGRFCTTCGAPVRCPQGHIVSRAGLRFCETCGQPLTTRQAAARGEAPLVEVLGGPPMLKLQWRLTLSAGLLLVAAGLILFQA